MNGQSRPQCAVLAFAALAMMLGSVAATAQTNAPRTGGDNSAVGVSQVSDGSSAQTEAFTQTPAAQIDADPIPPTASSAGSEPTGPSSSAATAGFHQQSTSLSRQQMADRADASHSVVGVDGALMIVGGAGFIAGLIIGGGAGTAIAIAGAVIALYGLYLYLR